jgi:hypothetical protein
MQYCRIAVLCLIGGIMDPYYLNVILIRFSTEQSALVFSNTSKPGKFQKKSLTPTLLLIQIVPYIANEEAKKISI